MDTIFDKIISKTIPAKIVLETPRMLAFHDINPQAPVHILVIPKKKAVSMDEFSEWDDATVGQFFKGIAEVARSVGLNKNGYRVVLNTKLHGCQSVNYVHAHILGGHQLSGSFA